MGDAQAAPEPVQQPGKRRWKLWHLAALVAGSAVAMAVAVRFPSLLIGFSIAGALGAPLVLAVLARDRLLGRLLRSCGIPPESFRASLVKAVLFAVVLFAFARWVPFVFAMVRLVWTD